MQFFGQYLIQEKVITVEQLREALELMNKQNLMLGQLAVEEKYLTESEANQINREQRYTDRPFGSIAISQDLLDDDQVKRLLELQQEKRIRIGEALVQLSYLVEEDLGKHLSRFKTKQDPLVVHTRELPGYLHGNRLAEYILELIPRTIRRVSALRVKIPGECEKVGRLSTPVVASILVRFEQGLRIALCTDEEFATHLMQSIFGAPPSESQRSMEDILNDAVAEFLNIVAGTALAGLEQEGLDADLDPPILGIPPLEGFGFELACTFGTATLILSEP